MKNHAMSFDMMEYVVWVIEVTAEEFFAGDKAKAYDTLKNSKLWSLYVDHYDVTHTLGAEYLIREMREYFIENGVEIL